MLDRSPAGQALSLAVLTLAGVLGSAASTEAQVVTESYQLENVWLLPDVSHPSSPPQQMFGAFDWTYTVGDFENGDGQFTSLSLPWTSASIASLEFTFDLKSIEIVMPGDVHGNGLDLTLVLSPPLASGQVSPVDPSSTFDIEVGISHKGHIISGNVVPDPTTVWLDLGSALAGSNGLPILAGSGEMTAMGTVALDLTSALEDSTAALVMGLSELNTPFKGGVLVPAPLLILAGLPTDPAGAYNLQATWPAGVPSGVTSYFQFWVTDVSAPAGFSASNGLSGTTP